MEPEEYLEFDSFDEEDNDCHEDYLNDYSDRKGQTWEQYWQGVMDGTQPL